MRGISYYKVRVPCIVGRTTISVILYDGCNQRLNWVILQVIRLQVYSIFQSYLRVLFVRYRSCDEIDHTGYLLGHPTQVLMQFADFHLQEQVFVIRVHLCIFIREQSSSQFFIITDSDSAKNNGVLTNFLAVDYHLQICFCVLLVTSQDSLAMFGV